MGRGALSHAPCGVFCLFPWVQKHRTMPQIACVWKACQSHWQLIKRKTTSGPRFSRAIIVWEQEKAAFLCGGTRLRLRHFPPSYQHFQCLKETEGRKGRGGFSSSLAFVAPAGPAEGDDTSWQQVPSSFPSVTCLPGLCSESGRLHPPLGRCLASSRHQQGQLFPGWAGLMPFLASPVALPGTLGSRTQAEGTVGIWR